MFYVSIESHLNLSAQLSHELFVNLSSKIDFVSREWSFHELFNIRYINNFLIHPMCILKKDTYPFFALTNDISIRKQKKKKKKKWQIAAKKYHIQITSRVEPVDKDSMCFASIWTTDLINGNSSSGLRIDFWILRGL